MDYQFATRHVFSSDNMDGALRYLESFSTAESAQNLTHLVETTNNMMELMGSKDFDKTLPQLNGHIPMGHDIYIYGSYGARDVTYLAGFDYTSKELETLLCKQEKERADLFEKHHNEMEYAVNSLGLDNHFGVETYPRKAYTTKKFNDKTIINWIGNPYAPIYEKNVRNFVLNPDDPEVEKIDYSKDLSDNNENED